MDLIRTGQKVIELRAYELPVALIGNPMAIIVTSDGQEGVSSLPDHVLPGHLGANVVSRVTDNVHGGSHVCNTNISHSLHYYFRWDVSLLLK